MKVPSDGLTVCDRFHGVSSSDPHEIPPKAGDGVFVKVIVSSNEEKTNENDDKRDIVMECEDDVVNGDVTLGEGLLEVLADV